LRGDTNLGRVQRRPARLNAWRKVDALTRM